MGLEPVGKEKLTDPLLAGRSTPVSSCTLDRPDDLWPFLLLFCAIPVGPRLDPRPLARFGGGEATRIPGFSRLAARRCDLVGMGGWPDCIDLGMAGTGGASGELGTGPEAREGDGSRNVRSVMEPELPRRTNCDPGGPYPVPDPELPTEDVEPALLIVLLVCTSATEMGVVGRDLNAAAAAAAERDAFEAWLRKKACEAAVVADALAMDTLGDCEYRVSSCFVCYVMTSFDRMGPGAPSRARYSLELSRQANMHRNHQERTVFDAALLLLFPNIVDSASANQGPMRALSH